MFRSDGASNAWTSLACLWPVTAMAVYNGLLDGLKGPRTGRPLWPLPVSMTTRQLGIGINIVLMWRCGGPVLPTKNTTADTPVDSAARADSSPQLAASARREQAATQLALMHAWLAGRPGGRSWLEARAVC
jgi:hypothetical protein